MKPLDEDSLTAMVRKILTEDRVSFMNIQVTDSVKGTAVSDEKMHSLTIEVVSPSGTLKGAALRRIEEDQKVPGMIIGNIIYEIHEFLDENYVQTPPIKDIDYSTRTLRLVRIAKEGKEIKDSTIGDVVGDISFGLRENHPVVLHVSSVPEGTLLEITYSKHFSKPEKCLLRDLGGSPVVVIGSIISALDENFYIKNIINYAITDADQNILNKNNIPSNLDLIVFRKTGRK